MGQQRSGDERYQTFEHEALEDRHEVLRQVLLATAEGRRIHRHLVREKYQAALTQFRNSPWQAETIGVALVEIALESWFAGVHAPQPARRQLIEDIAQALFDDPQTSARLEAWWNEMRESNP